MNALAYKNLTLNDSPLTVSYKADQDRQFEINFCSAINSLVVRGWSVKPEYAERYRELINQIKVHLIIQDKLTVYLAYELFNTSTAKFIFNLIRLFNEQYKAGKQVHIEWMVSEENDELFDTALDYREFCRFPFTINVR